MAQESRKMLSLVSRGSRYQLKIALILVSVLPLLCFAFIAIAQVWVKGIYAVWSQVIVGILALVIGLSGYLMLRPYPRNIERLRDYLRDMAAGELPEHIRLLHSEDDVSAVEKYLNVLLDELRRKLDSMERQLEISRRMQGTIEKQADELIVAERQRVMIESLAAACHHIGQPTTVLRVRLDMLMRDADSDRDRERIEGCMHAVEAIASVLDRLRHVNEYRTIPYHTYKEAGIDQRILDISAAVKESREGEHPVSSG